MIFCSAWIYRKGNQITHVIEK